MNNILQAKTRKKAIEFIEKQKHIELQMLWDMKNYVNKKDKKYDKLKQNHLDKITILDYILLKIGGNK